MPARSADTDLTPGPPSRGGSEPAPGAARREPATFWFAYWLAATMVLTKAVHLARPPAWTASRAWEYVKDLLVATAADAVFVLALAAVGQLALVIARRRPRLRRRVWATWVAVCAACAAYAVASVPIFEYFNTPLTYQLLYLAADLRRMASSIAAYATPGAVAALLGGTMLYLVAATASHRWVGLPGRRPMAAALALTAMLVALQWVLVARGGDRWKFAADHRIKQNPHWALVHSLLNAAAADAVELNDRFPPENLADFRTVAERTAGAGPATRPGAPRELSLPPHRPRNVVLFVLESVATQHMSLYGSPYPTTPVLDREAKNALIFDNVYAHVGFTASSLVSITLSTYPGISWKQYTRERPDLPGVTLAQVLKPRGYRTAFLSAADLDFSGQEAFLAGRGFDVVLDQRAFAERLNSWGASDGSVVDRTLQWIDEGGGRPFFVVDWTTQTHHPYQPAQGQPLVAFCGGGRGVPYEHRDLNRYLNCLHEADRQIGRLLDGLRRRGLADDTLVIITGDHGEGFDWPHPCTGHGHLVWQESTNVPCVLWNPKLFAGDPARHVATVGGHIDLNPTIAELLGAEPAGTWQGHSLLDASRPPRTYFYAASSDYLLGVREGELKYIYNATTGYEQLYDLKADPAEQTNLAQHHRDRCARLRGYVAAWVHSERGRG